MRVAAVFRATLTAAAAVLASGCTAVNYPPDTLVGTSWRVVAVNGTATPAQGYYSMRFDASGGIAARFGCNHISGRYFLYVSTMTVTDLTLTLMGCPEPAMTFESQGAAVLGRPMQVAFSSSERMVLSNAAGSITVDRLQ